MQHALSDSEDPVQTATCTACCALEEQVILLERKVAGREARGLKVEQENERLQQQLPATTAETAMLCVEFQNPKSA